MGSALAAMSRTPSCIVQAARKPNAGTAEAAEPTASSDGTSLVAHGADSGATDVDASASASPFGADEGSSIGPDVGAGPAASVASAATSGSGAWDGDAAGAA